MSTFAFESDADPTRLILVAAHRLAAEFELPDLEVLRELVAGEYPHIGREVALADFADRYAQGIAEVLKFRRAHYADTPLPGKPLEVALATLTVDATTMAWPIRLHAQGVGTVAPDRFAWRLLVMAVALATVQVEEFEGFTHLSTWLTEVAGEIEDAAGGAGDQP